MVFISVSLIKTHRETSRDALLEFIVLREICLFVYVYSVTKNKITKPYAKKFDGLLVNDEKLQIKPK